MHPDETFHSLDMHQGISQNEDGYFPTISYWGRHGKPVAQNTDIATTGVGGRIKSWLRARG